MANVELNPAQADDDAERTRRLDAGLRCLEFGLMCLGRPRSSRVATYFR